MLTDEKIELWRRRFFEAQAAAEEFITEQYGDDGIDAWTHANATITARLIRSRDTETGEDVRDTFLRRLHRQLSLYESEIDEPVVDACGARVLRNRVCGILRYRLEAQRSGVGLTFETPCGYCQSLNGQIFEQLSTGDAVVSCSLVGKGCEWRTS